MFAFTDSPASKPILHALTWILIAIASALSLWVCFCNCSPWMTGAPAGCDEFGYLYQAEAIRRGNLFGNHTDRPFMDGLVKDLSDKGFNPQEFGWPMAPHAYRYDIAAGQYVNQYPPGTAALLAPLPWEYRRIAFTIVVFLLALTPLLLFVRESGWRLAAKAGVLILIPASAIWGDPIRHEFGTVTSVAPTIPLLIAAGYFLRSRPALAICLVSVSFLFRIPNAFLLPPIAIALLFSEYFSNGDLPGWRNLFTRSFKSLGLFLVCGGIWILLYQWIVMGSPFRTTYPYYDEKFASYQDYLFNLKYYLNPLQPWTLFHIIVLLAIAALFGFERYRRRWLCWAIALALWNYVFYIIHSVHTGYYLNGSALLLAGLVLSGLDFASKAWLRTVTAICALALVVTLVQKWAPAPSQLTAPMEKQKASFEKLFGNTDVVWADGLSGSVEYLTGRAGFRMGWGSPEIRIEMLQWLYQNGYSQVIWLDDIGMDPERSLAELDKSGVPYTIENDPDLHRIARVGKRP